MCLSCFHCHENIFYATEVVNRIYFYQKNDGSKQTIDIVHTVTVGSLGEQKLNLIVKYVNKLVQNSRNVFTVHNLLLYWYATTSKNKNTVSNSRVSLYPNSSRNCEHITAQYNFKSISTSLTRTIKETKKEQ